jgi:hypothetical protein
MSHALEGFSPVVSLMDRIVDSGNKFPRVRLAFGDSDLPFVLTRSGAKSRVPGSVNLTDGKPYGENVWYGKISPMGAFMPSSAAKSLPAPDKRSMWALMSRMRAGEAESVFAEFGKKFGVCCMCGRELTNPESVALGIGPVCRQRAF